jgi:hypothetical protein
MRRFLRLAVGGWVGRPVRAGLCVLAVGALGLGSGRAQASEDPSALELDGGRHLQASSPWYLPRQVTLGGFAGRTVTPQLRLEWEFTLIQERADALMFVLQGGGGWALSTTLTPDEQGNPGLSWFFEHTVQAGIGYRQEFAQDWAFGFKVTAGPGWVGARSPGLDDERALIGLVEGRVEVGRYFGTTQVGLLGGLQTVMKHQARQYASHGAGGVLFGLFVNWR